MNGVTTVTSVATVCIVATPTHYHPYILTSLYTIGNFLSNHLCTSAVYKICVESCEVMHTTAGHVYTNKTSLSVTSHFLCITFTDNVAGVSTDMGFLSCRNWRSQNTHHHTAKKFYGCVSPNYLSCTFSLLTIGREQVCRIIISIYKIQEIKWQSRW